MTTYAVMTMRRRLSLLDPPGLLLLSRPGGCRRGPLGGRARTPRSAASLEGVRGRSPHPDADAYRVRARRRSSELDRTRRRQWPPSRRAGATTGAALRSREPTSWRRDRARREPPGGVVDARRRARRPRLSRRGARAGSGPRGRGAPALGSHLRDVRRAGRRDVVGVPDPRGRVRPALARARRARCTCGRPCWRSSARSSTS